MLERFAILLAAAVLLSIAMTFAYIVRLATGRSGWIDAIWSATVGCAGLAAVGLMQEGDPLRRAVIAGLVALWSMRLAGHVLARTRGAPDDPRYAALVDGWGTGWRRSLFAFLQAQAAAGVVLTVAIASAAGNAAPFATLSDLLGLGLALGGLTIEGIADRRLRIWRATRPADRPAICDVGLWGRTRHPNYLGEILFWWGLPLLAFDPDRTYWSLLALAAPLLMTHLLVSVSGIPPLEAHMARTRGTDWQAYCRRVPKILPRL